MATSLGTIFPKKLLEATGGDISGKLNHDGKQRRYERQYHYRKHEDGVEVSHNSSFDDAIVLPEKIGLDFPKVGFFGMYAGDGSKGSEGRGNSDRVRMKLSFSQKNPTLSLFAVRNIKEIFGEVPVKYSIASDSAYFLNKKEELETFRKELIRNGVEKSELDPDIDLDDFEAEMSDRDREYIKNRGRGAAAIDTEDEAKEVLRWWYKNKEVMKRWLEQDKADQLRSYGIEIDRNDEIYGNTRRPFVKGARRPGQDSRTDDTDFPTLSKYAELFVHLVEGVERSIIRNKQSISDNGKTWIAWKVRPDKNPNSVLDVEKFLTDSKFCQYVTDGGETRRHKIKDRGTNHLEINKPYGTSFKVPQKMELAPNIIFAGGLYMAEGDTPKEVIGGNREREKYYAEPDASSRMALGFNSSTNEPMEAILTAMEQMFTDFEGEVMSRWKLKIGSAYEPETVAVAEKMGLTFSRRGKKGQGKSRSLALGSALVPWALSVIPALEPYDDFFSHIEPTGAGIPRVDLTFSGSPNVYTVSLFYCLLFEPDHIQKYCSTRSTTRGAA